MAEQITMAVVGLFCTLLSSIITFLLTKKRYNAEVDSQQIENMNKSFDLYKNMMEENFNAQNKKLENIKSESSEKIKALQSENSELRQQVSQLQMQMINILGSICLDSTCKLRKANFTSDLKVSDTGVIIGE